MTTKSSPTKSSTGFSEAEIAAMKARAEELKAEKGGKKKADDLTGLLEKIAELPDDERAMAEELHRIVTKVAPQLDAKTWYGMPAWARDGKVVCFFKPASKFGQRYSTFGFEEAARLDDGPMWVTSYALLELGDAEARRIEELVRAAAG